LFVELSLQFEEGGLIFNYLVTAKHANQESCAKAKELPRIRAARDNHTQKAHAI